MVEDGEGEVQTESLYSSYKIKKTTSLWSKKVVFIENRDAVIGRFFTLSMDGEKGSV